MYLTKPKHIPTSRHFVPKQLRHNKIKSIDVLYQNVRGLKTKLSTWRTNLLQLEHNLIAVTESFLDASVEDGELVTADWNIMRRDRGTPCGGVMLAARAPIALRRRCDLETDRGEDLWADFTWCGRTVHVCVVYIKPSASDDMYMGWFSKVEEYIHNLKGIVIILGDLNLNSASLNIKNYYCYFVSFCSLNEMNDVKNSYGGMLDVVLVQENISVPEAFITATEGIVPLDAYHPALHIEVRVDIGHYSDSIEPSNIDSAKDWNFRKCNFKELYSLLSNKSIWDEVLESTDVQIASRKFYNIIYNFFDTCMPKTRRGKSANKRYPVWFTSDIIQNLKLKLKLHKNWKLTKCDSTYLLFSDLRSSLKARIADAYSTYMRNIESAVKTNPRQFWSHISSLRSKGGFEPNIKYRGITFSGSKAAGAFAEFFSDVFLPDVPRLNADHVCLADQTSDSNYINIPPLCPIDIVKGINKLKPNSSVGPDNIPPFIVKDLRNILSEPLCHIFNLALQASTYPSEWKVSRVTPIPKSQNKSSVEDYRPIAILSSPAKVFENILHNAIYEQIDKYLCNEQHGFRSKRSVDTNLLTLVDYISSSLDRGRQVDVLYFDFRKAFDRVNNDALLMKLSKLGFSPSLLRFFADYLRDRQQFVRLGMYESGTYHTRSGVSQGSILGPLLFLIMVNDLPQVLCHARCLLYADDLKLYLEINSERDCLALQQDIDAICKWSADNKMDFNSSKCFAMTFGRVRHPVNFEYNLNNETITISTAMKDLGVTFDRKLTFHDHMATVAKQSYQRLGFVLRNCREFRSAHAIKIIFNALVRSKLESSSCVWNPHESTYALLLEKVQKAFLRFLYKRIHGYYPYLYPTKFLLGCLGYNSLEVRRARDQLTKACKTLRGTIDAPDLLAVLARFFVPDNYCRGKKHRLFAVPPCRTVARAKSPIPRTLAALNDLLDTNPTNDLFADEWSKILLACQKYCERNS